MTKVVINACYGGFSVSRAGFLKLREMGNAAALAETDDGEMYPDGSGPRNSHGFDAFLREIPREDPQLIELIETVGSAADGACARLRVVEVPDDASWEISEYDGYEHVAETHRTWG